jgi:hypothetical protein
VPKALERELFATARKRHYGRRRTGAYVYGTLRKLGWRPRRRRKR